MKEETTYNPWDELIKKLKKYGAILAFLINTFLFVASLFTGSVLTGLLFFFNSFILLDYLFKFHRTPKELEKVKEEW